MKQNCIKLPSPVWPKKRISFKINMREARIQKIYLWWDDSKKLVTFDEKYC